MNSLPADHKYQLCTELTRKTVCFILYLWLRFTHTVNWAYFHHVGPDSLPAQSVWDLQQIVALGQVSLREPRYSHVIIPPVLHPHSSISRRMSSETVTCCSSERHIVFPPPLNEENKPKSQPVSQNTFCEHDMFYSCKYHNSYILVLFIRSRAVVCSGAN